SSSLSSHDTPTTQIYTLSLHDALPIYNQYLFLEARPGSSDSNDVLPIEESVDELRKYVNHFVITVNDKLDEWKNRLLEMKKTNKKIAVWGGGSKSVGFLTHFNDLGVIKHVVDINPHMQGNYIPGIGIQYVPPKYMETYQPDIVIIMNGVYEKEIKKMLYDMNLTPELIS